MFFYLGRTAHNRARLLALRDSAPSAVEAFALMFLDDAIRDDGTLRGRLGTIFAATEHRLIPGLHIAAEIGVTGFREAYQDPWKSSSDQVGHFLTAVRLAYDADFLRNPILLAALGAFGDQDVALRLVIGHEKCPDPPAIDGIGPATLFTLWRCLRAQYQSVTDEDIRSFLAGRLEAIGIGGGLGNSMADLRLSYAGWSFGKRLLAGEIVAREEVARWVRSELGPAQPP